MSRGCGTPASSREEGTNLQHERLWAPWRLAYIKGSNSDDSESRAASESLSWLPGADQECFLCRCVADNQDRLNLVVARSSHTVTVLNRYPYVNGHLLVAPRLHKASLADLSDEEHLDCMRAITHMVGKLTDSLRPQGFNVGLNLGRAAGAGLPGHLHWHIVPRWTGDTNFMPVLAGVGVIPQALEALWEILAEPPASREASNPPAENP